MSRAMASGFRSRAQVIDIPRVFVCVPFGASAFIVTRSRAFHDCDNVKQADGLIICGWCCSLVNALHISPVIIVNSTASGAASSSGFIVVFFLPARFTRAGVFLGCQGGAVFFAACVACASVGLADFVERGVFAIE